MPCTVLVSGASWSASRHFWNRCIWLSSTSVPAKTSSEGAWIAPARGNSLPISQLPQGGVAVRPAALHLHPELEEHLRAEQRLHRVARLGADALQRRALLADHDRLVAGLVDVDGRGHAPQG